MEVSLIFHGEMDPLKTTHLDHLFQQKHENRQLKFLRTWKYELLYS